MKPFPVVAIVCLLLGACAEVSFKRGATPADMEEARADCRKTAGGDPEAISRCMQERGWVVKRLGSDSPATAASAAPQETSDRKDVEPPMPAANAAETAVAPRVPAKGAAKTTGAPSAAAGTKSAAVKPAAAPTDMKRKVEITSWWKLGGNPDQLALAEKACVAKLGVEHRPDPGSLAVTLGMLACLREKGWHGIQ